MAYLEIREVVKRYSGHVALDGVSLSVERGSIHGLLGPNGAGKTSLLRIINMITRPDSGEVLLDGHPLNENDVSLIGYLPEERGLYKKSRVGDVIVYLARLKGMPKSIAVKEMERWLDRFALTEWKRRKVEELSKGMQQKVQFISTVLHRPQLLIFDEPFSGFDPVNAEQLKREILALRDEGATILFSTHNMSSVEAVCERFTLLNHSRVVLDGNVAQVKQQFKKNIFEVGIAGGTPLSAMPGLFSLTGERTAAGEAAIVIDPKATVKQVIAALNEKYQLTSFSEVLPSMNEIFIEIVGGENNKNNNPTTPNTTQEQ